MDAAGLGEPGQRTSYLQFSDDRNHTPLRGTVIDEQPHIRVSAGAGRAAPVPPLGDDRAPPAVVIELERGLPVERGAGRAEPDRDPAAIRAVLGRVVEFCAWKACRDLRRVRDDRPDPVRPARRSPTAR